MELKNYRQEYIFNFQDEMKTAWALFLRFLNNLEKEFKDNNLKCHYSVQIDKELGTISLIGETEKVFLNFGDFLEKEYDRLVKVIYQPKRFLKR